LARDITKAKKKVCLRREKAMNTHNMNFGLLKFCLEHSDDPQSITNSKIDENRDAKDYEFLLAALNDLESELQKVDD
jgi:hypothetical protein